MSDRDRAAPGAPRRLMVVAADRVSSWIEKGEVVPRYLNPGDLFDEVHLVLTNDDRPDPGAMGTMVGGARAEVHNLTVPRGLFRRTLGWRPRLLRPWARRAVEIAEPVGADLVRAYGVGLNSFAASEVRRRLGIPFVVSLHGNPDVDYGRGRLARTAREKIEGRAIEAAEVVSLRAADLVLPVYSPIVPYLDEHGIDRYEVVYNAVGYEVEPKRDYAIGERPARALCVGRQQSLQKDPAPIIDAVAAVPGVELTLIGDGDLHQSLIWRARASGAAERISFVRAMPNREVLLELSRTDLYLYSSVNYELSKTCIEAALTGLPLVLNDRGGEPAEELVGDHVRLVDGTADAYRRAIEELLRDPEARESLGRRARRHALEHWAPELQERRVATLYRGLLEGRPGRGSAYDREP